MASPTEPVRRPETPAGGSDQVETTSARAAPRRRGKAQPEAGARREGPPNVILVGCGPHAQQAYVPALRTLQQSGALNVSAIVDAAGPARDWCQVFFPKAVAVASVDTVVTPPDALAIIASPSRFHTAQANAAVKRGWHVLCATPFAPSARDAALMIATAQQHERVLAIDLPHRFYPAARYLRTLCHDHLLGPPISFTIHEGAPRAVPAHAPAAGDKFESPDGVLNDVGVRTLDLLTWWLGSPSVKQYADDAMGGVEANARIELTFPESVRGTVHLSCDWPSGESYTFIFERGIVCWDAGTTNRLTLQIASAGSALSGELGTPLSAHQLRSSSTTLLATPKDAIVAEIQNILAAISHRETLRVPATEAMHALHLVEECYARRTPLEQPWLPQGEAVNARAFAPPSALRRP